MSKFNIIQDKNSYYFFRALNYGDGLDIQRGITFEDGKVKRIRTDRERCEERKGTAKYNSQSKITLNEVYDHVKNRYIKETNCISLSKNANISLEYGQLHENGYILVKVDKKDMGNTYDAGKYMLEEIQKSISGIVGKLPENSEVLSVINKIKNATSRESIIETIANFYEELKSEKFISKEAIFERLEGKQHFSKEQQQEYNRIIGMLTVLEVCGELKSILPTRTDNSYLIGAIGSSLSNGEIIHYGDIEEQQMYQISSETVNIFALIQQLKEKNIDEKVLETLEQKAIERAVSENAEISICPEGKQTTNDRYNKALPIEEVYRLTKGRIGYEKAQIAIEFVKNLSRSRLGILEYLDSISELCDGNQEVINTLINECYVINKDIINRGNVKGVKIVSSVNAGLDKNKSRFVSDNEQTRLINSVVNMRQEELQSIVDSNGLNLEDEILESILDKNEEVTENYYFSEAIVDALNFEKIYRKTNGSREVSEEEIKILIEKLNKVDCKKIYNAFFRIGKKHDVISGYIVNLLINGYRNESLVELSNREDINEYISDNIGNLSPVVKALKLDKVFGIEDEAFAISGTGIKLRDDQKETVDNMDEIYNEKRFAGVISPTGSGKSFIAIVEMLKYKNSKIVFIAPQKTILYQFKKHIENSLGLDYFPYLSMFCYDTIAERDEDFFENLNADLFIFDEAHRAGAPTYQPKIQKMLDRNPNAQILGMTATPVRDIDKRDMLYELAKMSGSYTEKELVEKKYLASEMYLLDAMKDDIVVTPKVVTFDYNLDTTEEYAEVKRMLHTETDPGKKAELDKIYKEMTAIIKKAKKEGIDKIFNDNIKKRNGRYIIFLPRNSTELSSEEYVKQQIEIIKGYFKDIDSNPSISYLLSDREGGDRTNLEALKEFEDEKGEHSEHLKLIFAIDKLNEGVHVNGIDGEVMLRPISENSKILYTQQIGRSIFPIDPDNPVKDKDRPIIFDVYNNYLVQNMDREINRTTPDSDLHRLQVIVNYINKHKGYIPDINSDDIKEAKKAVALKRIQKKYSKYIDGIDDSNLSESEQYEVEEILRWGKSISLWEIEIPDRIVLPGEKEIGRNDTFRATGTQRDFLELFRRSREIGKNNKISSNLRLRSILDILDILAENGLHINNRSIRLDSTLGEVLKKFPEEDRQDILAEIGVGLDFKIGEEYNYAKEEFYKGKTLFVQYDVCDLRRFGIFSPFFDKIGKERTCVSRSFISNGPSELININIITGRLYGEDGFDVKGWDVEGYYMDGYNKNGFNRNGINKQTGKEYDINYFDKDGYFYTSSSKGECYRTNRKVDDYNFDIDGYYYELQEDGSYQKTDRKLDKHGFDRYGYYYRVEGNGHYRKTDRKVDEYCFDRDGYYYQKRVDRTYKKTDSKLNNRNFDIDGYYYELQEDGSYQRTDRKVDEHGFGKDGYYYEVEEDGDYQKTDRKLDKHGFDRDGIYWKLAKKFSLIGNESKFVKTDRKIDDHNFDIDGYYYEKKRNRTYKTDSKLNSRNFDIDGYYYELQEDGTYKKTGSKIDRYSQDIDGLGHILQEDGTYKVLDEYGFDEEGHYYELQENGAYQNTGSKLDRHNFDKEGYYWKSEKDGTYKNTFSKTDERGFYISGYISDEGRKYDSEKYDLAGYDIDGINRQGFNKRGYYCVKDFRGIPQSTGLKYNPRGFMADGNHIVTKTRLDIRKFDINGKYFEALLYKIGKEYDENGFNADGTYMETGEMYHCGYNAYGVDENGKDKFGEYPPEIQFGREYVKAVCKGKVKEVLEKYYDLDREKIDFTLYKAMEMYPKLKEVTTKYIASYIDGIKNRGEKLKELRLECDKEKSEIEKLEMEIRILKNRIRSMSPVQGFNKQ